MELVPWCSCLIRSLLQSPAHTVLLRGWQRHLTTSCARCANSHYTALGITPSATQADVKAAYYKLTKLYHPDRLVKGATDTLNTSEAEEHIEKFREVTAAYEVLGNVKLRRLYDKGMHHVGSRGTQTAWRAPEEEDPAMKFYRSRELKSRPPPPTNNAPLYDFDEWSKQHYGATFIRDQKVKKKQQYRSAAAESAVNDIKIERILIAMGVMVIMMMIINADINRHDQPVFNRSGRTPPPTAATPTSNSIN